MRSFSEKKWKIVPRECLTMLGVRGHETKQQFEGNSAKNTTTTATTTTYHMEVF